MFCCINQPQTVLISLLFVVMQCLPFSRHTCTWNQCNAYHCVGGFVVIALICHVDIICSCDQWAQLHCCKVTDVWINFTSTWLLVAHSLSWQWCWSSAVSVASSSELMVMIWCKPWLKVSAKCECMLCLLSLIDRRRPWNIHVSDAAAWPDWRAAVRDWTSREDRWCPRRRGLPAATQQNATVAAREEQNQVCPHVLLSLSFMPLPGGIMSSFCLSFTLSHYSIVVNKKFVSTFWLQRVLNLWQAGTGWGMMVCHKALFG